VSQQAGQPDILEVISDLSNDEVFTPPKVVNADLDLLPVEVWTDPDLRWLDPGSKTGVFLREVTRRLLVGLEPVFPDEQERVDHILTNMVFGIAITELTALMSRRTLYCSKNASGQRSVVAMSTESGNIWQERVEHPYVKGRCSECSASEELMERPGRENYAYGFIHAAGRAAIEKEFEMKFDVIVGNPPYQMGSDGGTRTMPLYNLFVDHARSLNPRYISMIIPARWMAGGLGLDDFRVSMLSDRRIRQLVDYPNSAELFPTVDIKSGICYFLWDRDNSGDCEVTLVRGQQVSGPHTRRLNEYDVFVRDRRGLAILKKVEAFQEDSMFRLVRGKNPFGLRTNFQSSKSRPSLGAVRLYRSGAPEWVRRDQVGMNQQWIDEWKVLVPKAGPGNSGGHVLPDMVLGQPLVGEPGSCCTETYMVIGPVDSETEATSLVSLLRTRFCRFLVSLRKISQDAPRGTYSFVPQQTWDQVWTDDELFAKYGITDDEQAYIAEMIREMPG
jgi:site-specific DNA-methyltransferase (adenine-specific)